MLFFNIKVLRRQYIDESIHYLSGKAKISGYWYDDVDIVKEKYGLACESHEENDF